MTDQKQSARHSMNFAPVLAHFVVDQPVIVCNICDHQALESVDVPNIRQVDDSCELLRACFWCRAEVGVFDPVAQMLPASQNVEAQPKQRMYMP